MKPPPFDYYEPSSLDEALTLMSDLDDVKVLAGGQSLMPMLNMRYVVPQSIVDLNRVQELQFCRAEGESLVIGCMTRQRDLEASNLAREKVPLLVEALSHVGHLQTRTRGTLGGSLCHLDPAAELPVVALALDATLRVRSSEATREIDIRDFPTFYMTPDLEPNEILTEITFPVWVAGVGYAFEEFARRHGDFAVVSVAVNLKVDSGRIVYARIAIGGVGAVPQRAESLENGITGRRPDEAVLAEAMNSLDDVECIGDIHASAEYRRHLLTSLTRRAITRAALQAIGES